MLLPDNSIIVYGKQFRGIPQSTPAVMVIEASAKREHLSGQEMHRRLKKQGLIHERLFKHYELLHTQSLSWVVDDTIETLHNWENEPVKEGRQ